MIPAHIQQSLQQHVSNSKELWVGYSGGLDSTVLLHLAVKAFGAECVKTVHVNHRLSPDADEWQAHCHTQSARFGVHCVSEAVHLDGGNKGIENAAREARYGIFERLLKPSAILLLAHHQNDQAETLLFRLMRGAGLKGLGGIQESRRLANGALLMRPLLSVTRAELESYAQVHGLQWVDDESNGDESFDRNYLRHQIVPKIQEKWPQAVGKMAESAALLFDQQVLLNQYLDQDLRTLDRRKERVGESINLGVFQTISDSRKKALIRRWAEINSLDSPNRAHIDQLNDVIDAQEDANPCLNWGNAELRRFRRRLYLLPKLDYAAIKSQQWDPKFPLDLGQGMVLSCLNANELNLDQPLEIRPRNNSARCKPKGRAHSQTLKKLLQEYGLEPWLRNIVPCVYYQDEMIAVGDLFLCEVTKPYEGLTLSWQVH